MSAEEKYIQKTREAEFNRLLNSAANDTPLLLFPLRIETHFRKGRPKAWEENDTIKILRRFRDLLYGFVEHKSDKNYSFIPLMAKTRRAVDVADSMPSNTIVNLASLCKNIFEDFFIPLDRAKYSRHQEFILNALRQVTKDHGVRNAVTYASSTLFSPRNAYGYPLFGVSSQPVQIDLPFSLSDINAAVQENDFQQSSAPPQQCLPFYLLDFPGVANLFDSDELTARRLLALIENWISALEKELKEEELINDSRVASLGNTTPAVTSGSYGLEFPGAAILFNPDELRVIRQQAELVNASRVVPLEKTTPITTPGFTSVANLDELVAVRQQSELINNPRAASLLNTTSGSYGFEFPGASNLFNPDELRAIRQREEQSKELCVRIFPDEIFLDYLSDSLTQKEINDGKTFWLQWFIASGSRKREYEAWQILCDKYPVYRAAWIARQLRPRNINDFKKENGKLFYRRPYTKMAEIEQACENIYRDLAAIKLDESLEAINKDTGEFDVESDIRIYLGSVKANLFQIDRDVIFCEYIVDYLFDNILSTIEYLERRLDTFITFYEKYPGRYGGNNRQMELWDVDQTTLLTFRKEVDDFLAKLREKRILLDDMIQKYLDDPLHGKIFTFNKVNHSEKPDTPISNILPDRFMFIGEAENGRNEKIIRYGRRVMRNLQIGINPNEDFEEDPYNINEHGDLEVSGGLAWMVDYDIAEEAGMAITVPLDGSISKFKYVYVLGIKDAGGKEKQYLHGLFNSHNYTSTGLEMLKPDTPTNILEGEKPAYDSDPELEMLRRYEIEVEEAYKNERNHEYDSRIISDILNLDYDECWGHTVKFDNHELRNAEKANKVLWEYFRKNIVSQSPRLKKLLDFTGEFVTGHVKARGVLPSFRIGSKPYGILPTTDFLTLDKNIDPDDLSLIKQLTELLISLANKWKAIRDKEVISFDKLTGKDAAEKYLEMAGLTPHSTTFYERAMVGSPLLPKRESYTPPYLEPLSRTGFFDPLIVGGSEHEVSFDDSGCLPAELKNIVKAALFGKPSDKESESECECKSSEDAEKAAISDETADEVCELLVSEFIDLFTHRLDAWFSGIIDYLLRSRGKYRTPMIGAFGWVFDLDENRRVEIAGTERSRVIDTMRLSPLNPSDELRVYRNAGDDKGEYIVAPSIKHALSAAILRSAYLKTKETDGDSHMCVNLSSMRARQALRMISGISEGMSTGIILGADLERYLHEAHWMGAENEYEMNRYIYPLRKLFPQSVDLKAEDERAQDYVMNVINGEALLNTFMDDWRNTEPVASWLEKNRNKLPWYVELGIETRNDGGKHRRCLFSLIARIVDSYDALNDLLLAEGVHRLVQGDRASYSAISNFMIDGEGNLPEPAILETPMEYVVVANKAAVALPQCENPPNRPMCLAEPSVNLWLEELMGGLENVVFYIAQTGADGKAIYSSCTLGELGIAPIEYLYLSSNDNILIAWLEARWRLKNDCFTDSVKLYLAEPETKGGGNDVFDIDVFGKGAESFSLYENELRISRLRSLVLQGGVMKANDWIASADSDAGDEPAEDTDDLKSRYISLRTYLAQLSFDMRSCMKSLDGEACGDNKLVKMYELLCRCVESGLINSLPKHNRDMFIFNLDDKGKSRYRVDPILQRLEFDKAITAQQAFIENFAYVRHQLEKRIASAEEIVRMTSAGEYKSEQYVQAIKQLTLDNFKIFPHFTLHHGLTEDKRKEYDGILKQGIGRYVNISGMDFEEWQSDVAEVREGMKMWHHISMFEAMCNGDTGNVSILQTTSDGETALNKWLGVRVDDESELHDVDSLVIYNSGAVTGLAARSLETSYIAGIIIDAWPEFIPYKKQTAGMVFHCDQPDNEAPQSLLLALHPEFNIRSQGKRWGLKDVLELIDSTRFMLMNRAVEPDHIYRDSELSTLLPLLSTISIVPGSMRFSSGFFRRRRSSSVAWIFDMFPGGDLFK